MLVNLFLAGTLVSLAADVVALPVTTDPAAASNRTFDYIVVGGGTAGLTVARRLSENPKITVLVIEAGNDDRTDPRVSNPYNADEVYFSDLDWAYPTDQGKSIDAGKTLGGSSSINGMTWTRGLKAQYDSWSDLLDPKDRHLSWNWQSLFHYMKKAESFSVPTQQQEAKGATYTGSAHGYTGPVQVAYPELMYGGSQQPAFKETFVKLGVPRGNDVNGGSPNVVSFAPNSINRHDNDSRSSSATAYLSPVEDTTENWTTLVGQHVTRILFAPSASLPRIATGVQFGTSDGTRYTAYASREVIVSAGAIGSPAVLQLSGVGDPEKLGALGIASIVNLPSVGQNLQEQTLTLTTEAGNFSLDGSGPGDIIAYPSLYQLFRDNATIVGEYIRSSIPRWAELRATATYPASALEKIYNIQADLIINDKAPIAEILQMGGSTTETKFSTVTWQLLPFSRGSVLINSTDPFTKPQINVNWFSADIDLQIQVASLRFIRTAYQTPPLSNLTLGETAPGFVAVPDDPNHGSYEDWVTWIKGNYFPNSHPIATCAMSSRSLNGVVDGRLVVYDTKNVRVVDASVMPLQISAHLSSTVYGIAEKAADIIKAAQ